MKGKELIMSVKVLRDFIVVSKDAEKEGISAGGIIRVSLSAEKNVTGTVVAVGSGRITMNGTVVPLEVNPGDRVVFNKNAATEVQDGNDTVFVIREDQVVCVLN
jgi:chaperonin GroES